MRDDPDELSFSQDAECERADRARERDDRWNDWKVFVAPVAPVPTETPYVSTVLTPDENRERIARDNELWEEELYRRERFG